METTSHSFSAEKSVKKKNLSLSKQLISDFDSYLNQSTDRKKRLRLVSRKTGLHSKTLLRILRNETQPTYMTLFKLYRLFLNETNDLKVIEKCPETVKSYLKKANPQKLLNSAHYSSAAESEISRNPIALEILVLCSTGPISPSEVRERFGSYGLEVCKKLLSQNILSETQENLYTVGNRRMNLSPETVIEMGIHITSQYAKPENGYVTGLQFHGFFAEGMTPTAYNEWLKIDLDAFNKKVELASKPESSGPVRAYTFVSTDMLTLKENT